MFLGGAWGGGGGAPPLHEHSWWRVPLTRIAAQRSHGIAMAFFFKNVGRRPTMLSPRAGRGRRRRGGRRRRLRQQSQPEILRDVGVLIFIHQNELEAVLVVSEHVGVFAEQPDVLEQQIA